MVCVTSPGIGIFLFKILLCYNVTALYNAIKYAYMDPIIMRSNMAVLRIRVYSRSYIIIDYIWFGLTIMCEIVIYNPYFMDYNLHNLAKTQSML